MSPQDSPTPPAPAEVCDHLRLILTQLPRIGKLWGDETLFAPCEQPIASAIALIEQGEKERERLDKLAAMSVADRLHVVRCTSPTEEGTPNNLRAAIDAARAQPTPESK